MLRTENISKKYDGFSLEDVCLEVEKGDYYILLGESGAGKSVILEIIAGLIRPDSGRIMLNGKDITKTRIHDRKTGIVFQDYAVFPHMSVRKNIAYALKNAGRDYAVRKTEELADKMNIRKLLDRMPGTLSGGELQRVALARTLVTDPVCLLLDEPLASLDTHLKDEVIQLLWKLNREGQTVIHVSHDYQEAVSLATKAGVIHQGRIISQGCPAEVFGKPVSGFVAGFAGIRNFYPAVISGKNNARLEDKTDIRIAESYHDMEGFISISEKDILIRPERFFDPDLNCLPAQINCIMPDPLGIRVIANAGVIFSVILPDSYMCKMQLEEGTKVTLCFSHEAVKVIEGK